MLQHALFFLLGLVALVAGAELMVRGASRLALTLGVSPLVIGLTVVAFGTSAPELAVSLGAALDGRPALAIGNVIGSNIANVLLILGLSALIIPLAVAEQIIRQEIPVMIGAAVLMVVMSLDGRIATFEAAVLMILILAYTAFLVRQSRRASASLSNEFAGEIATTVWDRHWSMQLLLVAAGLALLVLGANWLVGAAVAVAQVLGVSDLVIGLTVVAVGTSMPEIATSLVAAARGERDIAVGNVIGSNVFNILVVIGATGLVAPGGIPVPDAARHFDLWVMLAVAFACVPIMLTGREIARWEGALFVAYYAAYTTWLVLEAQRHDALPAFSGAMLGYVLPLTVVTLIVSVVRHGQRATDRTRM